jgi:hypothetical protein
MFVRKIGLCEEKGLSGYLDVTGQQFIAATRVDSSFSQSSKPVNN